VVERSGDAIAPFKSWNIQVVCPRTNFFDIGLCRQKVSPQKDWRRSSCLVLWKPNGRFRWNCGWTQRYGWQSWKRWNLRRQSDEERPDCATLDCCYYMYHGNTDLVVRLRIWSCKRPPARNMVWTTRTGACRAAKRYLRTLMKVADCILNWWPFGSLMWVGERCTSGFFWR